MSAKKKTSKEFEQDFRLSRLTIRTKLMLLISSVIGLALFVMLQLVTFFYTRDMTANIQETNLKLANVIAYNVEAYIRVTSRSVRMFAETLQKSNAPSLGRDRLLDESDFVMFALFQRNQTLGKKILNQKFLQAHKIPASRMDDIVFRYKKNFTDSFQGQVRLINVSQGFQTPLLAISVPVLSNRIAIVVLDMRTILSSFQSPGLAEVYLVNTDGVVVVHPDRAVTLASKDFSALPIVRAMQSSKFNSSQNRYTTKHGVFLGSFKKIPSVKLAVIATVSENKALAGVYRIQRRNFYLMVTVICLAILLAFLFARQLVEPVKALTRAAKQILLGNYRIRLTPKFRDEIGLLTDTFNQMAQGLEERENLKESFGRFVNQEIAELSMSGGVGIGGERKECAILFSDIRGFTSISEKLRPEEVVDFLNEYFAQMVGCVNANQGIVDKFIGDALMAHWGALRSNKNDTQSAIDAALAMRQALKRLNESRGTKRRPFIQVGMGINTGSVIAGQIGSNERLEYTVIGDAVNLASRIETLTKEFMVDILITGQAHAKVRGLYFTEALHKIQVRGRARPVAVYAVLGKRGDPDAFQSLAELQSFLGMAKT